MLLKLFIVGNFQKTRKWLALTGIVLMLLGLAALTICVVSQSLESYVDGFYTGTGTGLVIFGLFMAIYYGIVLKNPEKSKKYEIDANDERNRFIIQRACCITFALSIIIQYIAVLVAGMIDQITFTVMQVVLAVELFIFIITNFILQRIH
jgi:hypothetical protein